MSGIWTAAYSGKSEAERSWTQAVPAESLMVIDSLDIPRSAPVIDIGGGASYLVDNLVERGFTDVTLLDVSPEALEESRARNGEAVSYVAHDITTWQPAKKFLLWHDRAVFHFLTTHEQQVEYCRALVNGTDIGSHMIIAVFAEDGPEMCSELPVRRWSSEDLVMRFEEHFRLVDFFRAEHTTPWGYVQPFNFVHLIRAE